MCCVFLSSLFLFLSHSALMHTHSRRFNASLPKALTYACTHTKTQQYTLSLPLTNPYTDTLTYTQSYTHLLTQTTQAHTHTHTHTHSQTHLLTHQGRSSHTHWHVFSFLPTKFLSSHLFRTDASPTPVPTTLSQFILTLILKPADISTTTTSK